jgi:hypothetical protein
MKYMKKIGATEDHKPFSEKLGKWCRGKAGKVHQDRFANQKNDDISKASHYEFIKLMELCDIVAPRRQK